MVDTRKNYQALRNAILSPPKNAMTDAVCHRCHREFKYLRGVQQRYCPACRDAIAQKERRAAKSAVRTPKDYNVVESGPTPFAQWVIGLMKHMGWASRDLGAAMGVDRVTVSRWRNGRTYPDARMRIRLNDLAREEGYDAVPRRWG